MDAQLMVVDLEHLLAVAADAIPPAPASDAEAAGSGCGDGALCTWRMVLLSRLC
jgi:hypothetical protein